MTEYLEIFYSNSAASISTKSNTYGNIALLAIRYYIRQTDSTDLQTDRQTLNMLFLYNIWQMTVRNSIFSVSKNTKSAFTS